MDNTRQSRRIRRAERTGTPILMKIGSLFSGYGGLDLAVERATGATTVWHCEWDEAPSKVLTHHWPGVPNYRDVTQVDWSTVEPVDIITGGSPCQDLSTAGKRAGMTEGTRSNLWVNMREAIAVIRPRLVVWENVQGALSAKATSDSDLEHSNGQVGDGGGGYLRALGRVLGDLTEIGYDARWTTLRASDIGAPHHRARIFLIAWPREHAPNTDDERRGQGTEQPLTGQEEVPSIVGVRSPAADPESRGWGDGQATHQRTPHREVHAPDNHRDATTDPGSVGLQARHVGTCGRTAEVTTTHHSDSAFPHPRCVDGETRCGIRPAEASSGGPQRDTSGRHNRAVEWGKYAPAIRRWECIVGPAPDPTELNSKGNPRLAAPFAEWMMGLPEGWVTSPEIGLTRAQQLKAIGNGVCPQQAEAAIRHLLKPTD